ncbi:MAG TPA: formate dehydrogenase [Desulfobacteraceae bacterium]|nr:Coenzyme F420 hydrogenase/dehydrogenase, beta subunit C-terminal domain [Deltaproteobacteria bacterium]RLB96364.1 MAG: formate dehydrogenase [Deltaproteobacteria bacterium]HDI59944.1 formate dehydrogenase [Desulfobacteraceae bacterium]
MAKAAMIPIENGNLLAGLRQFLRQVLARPEIAAVLVPCQLPMKAMVMPTLVSDPERLSAANPLAPAFPLNAARMVSRLTRKEAGGTIVAVLRACEIRAFIELVKLRQARWEELIIVGIDCLGAYTNKDFFRIGDEDVEAFTGRFVQSALDGRDGEVDGVVLAPACQVCTDPIPNGADLVIGLLGADTGRALPVAAATEKGASLLEQLDLPGGKMPEAREAAMTDWVNRRRSKREAMGEATRSLTDSLEKLTAYLATCINCYNCRVACPVCYCRECVFVTDVFDHEPCQYLGWAGRKGAVKMPTDTVFYHLTRLAHMGTACVGCGQCANACPNDIPLAELFITASAPLQEAFDYHPGRSLDEKPPLAEFREEEFEEVVGIK